MAESVLYQTSEEQFDYSLEQNFSDSEQLPQESIPEETPVDIDSLVAKLEQDEDTGAVKEYKPYQTGFALADAIPGVDVVTQTDKSEEELAADSRLESQCALVDYMKILSRFNKNYRNVLKSKQKTETEPNQSDSNAIEYKDHVIAMAGDTNYFSSFINGSDIKGAFLDFTTQQISSLVPVIKLYKVIQVDDKNTVDYLIPFSTHAAWRDASTTFKTIEDVFNEGFERPSDVGIKSFNWAFEGSNPVSARRDISAKLVLFSTNLENLVREFNIFPIYNLHNAPEKHCFRYVDLALRSGKKFDAAKDFHPQYYTIKINISWKTTNQELFTDVEMQTLKQNSTTMLLTLIDHQFNFEQDGSLTFTLDYRAYFEGVLFTQDADFIRTADQHKKAEEARKKIQHQQTMIESEQSDEEEATPTGVKSSAEKEYDKLSKEYDELITDINQESYRKIFDYLSEKERIYTIGVDLAQYQLYKKDPDNQKNGLVSGLDAVNLNEIDSTIDNTLNAIASISDPSQISDKLSTIYPQPVDGIKHIAFFYLGDLIQYAINSAYQKMVDFPNKPKFIVGSALYRTRSRILNIERVNILDIPISVDWFSEWYANTIISQLRTEYPVLYFMRDLCSRLIDGILSNKCDESGTLKMKNKFNISNFLIKKNESEDLYNDPLYSEHLESTTDLQVQEIRKIINESGINENLNYLDTSKTIQYIAIYCHDISSPVNINCDEDLKNGIYHFYFGKDRGLVKKISFTRAQTTGLRELNYLRESSGRGLQQLMTPYDVDVSMVGNNLFINGMMIFINPSGFGRNVGQPNDVNSVSYALKLGGYHTIYRIESSITPTDFSTNIKARWVGSGTERRPSTSTDAQPTIPTNPIAPQSVAATGEYIQTSEVATNCIDYDSGFEYPINTARATNYLGEPLKATETPTTPTPAQTTTG